MKIKVRYLDTNLEIDISIMSNIYNVKHELYNITKIPVEEQKLMFKGKILSKDDIISKDMKYLLLFSNNKMIETINNIDDIGKTNQKEITVENYIENYIDQTKKEQENIEKCWKCNVRIGLLGFKCKCSYVFCGIHRYFYEHDCTYDWLNHDREILLKQNKEIKQNKINKFI